MRIKELRTENHITQVQLADIIGISHKNISKYENLQREPDISTLIKVADYFNVTLDYLLERDTSAVFCLSPLTKKDEYIIKLYNNLTKRNQDLLVERAETMIELQEDDSTTKKGVC